MTTIPHSSTRHIAFPRIDVRLVLGIALVSVAVAGGLVFWNAVRQTTPFVVAAREIAPGHTITPDDLGVTEARVEGSLAMLAIREADAQSVIGRTAMEPIHPGALVLQPSLGSGPTVGPDQVAITIPVDANAVYPLLRAGDSVAVLATKDKGTPDSQTTTVLERATVYDVGGDATRVTLGSGDSDGDDQSGPLANVTVITPRVQVEQVTHALVDSQLTLVLLQQQGR